MSTLKSLLPALRTLLLWLAGVGIASAQNSIEAFDVTQQGGAIVVRVTTREPLQSVPANFTVANPARIAFDFPKTANALGRNAQEIGQGELRSMNLIQAADRSRLVLNLRRSVVHEARVDGRNLIITLQAAAVSTTAGSDKVAHFAEGRADARHSIRDVDFRRGRGGEGRVVVDLSDASTGIDIRQQGQNIVIDFLKTSLPDNLKRRLDVTDFATPVQSVNAFQQGDNARVVIEPSGQWEHNAYQTDTQFVVEVKPLVIDTSRGPRGRYTGEKLSLNFQNVEVRAVLNVIADFTDLNVVTSDSVAGSITLRLKDVPWDQALEIILQTRGLDMRKTGNVIWIAPRDELATREKLALESQQQITELEQTRTESFQLNYTKAVDVQKMLGDRQQPVLSKRGSAVVDVRTNTLFVQDVPSRLEEVRKLIAKIDIAVRQVMIEARIVEASDTFAKNLGARLGLVQDARLGNAHTFANGHLGLQTGAELATTAQTVGPPLGSGQLISGTPALVPNAQQVNLPAAGLSGFTAGLFSIILFKRDFSRFLTAELSALEADGKGKIISSPRVMTANQTEAIIEQGTEIPFQKSTSSGATSVEFRKAVLSLKVKPQITPDGNIIMTLEINKDSPGAGSGQFLQINTKHVKTEVLVENGGTVVIGGIYEHSERTDVTQVPFLGDLPYVGFLFRNRAASTTKTELLVFVTPRIVNERLTIR